MHASGASSLAAKLAMLWLLLLGKILIATAASGSLYVQAFGPCQLEYLVLDVELSCLLASQIDLVGLTLNLTQHSDGGWLFDNFLVFGFIFESHLSESGGVSWTNAANLFTLLPPRGIKSFQQKTRGRLLDWSLIAKWTLVSVFAIESKSTWLYLWVASVKSGRRCDVHWSWTLIETCLWTQTWSPLACCRLERQQTLLSDADIVRTLVMGLH